MAKIERQNLYRPQQVSQGFNPQTAPDVTSLLRENNQIMERDIEAQERVDDMAFDNEEQMMSLRQELENKEFEQLLSFSQKGLEFATNVRKGQIADEEAEASALFYENMSAVGSAELMHDEAMAELDGMRDSDNELANAAFQKGAPYDIVRRIRNLSEHGRAAYMEEMALNAGTMYRQFQDDQLASNQGTIMLGNTEVQLNDPQDIPQFTGVLAHNRKEFIKQLGISGMSAGLQAKAFKLMYEQDAKLSNEFQTNYNIDKGEEDRQTFSQQVKTGALSAQQALDQIANTPGKNGKGSYGYKEAHKFYIEEAVALYQSDPMRADSMMEEYGELELNGRKFKDIHDDKIIDYHTKKREESEKAFKAYDKGNARQLKERKQAILTAALQNPNFTQADADNEIREYLKEAVRLQQPAVIPKDLENMWQNLSSDAEKIELMMREQENKKNAYALDPEELQYLPPQVRDKYMKDAQAQQKARLGDLDSILDAAESFITKHPMVAADRDMEGAGLSKLIAADFKKLIRQDVIEGLKDDPNASPRVLAEQALAKHTDTFAKGIEDPKSRYYIGDGKGGKIFTNYLPDSGDSNSNKIAAAKRAIRLKQRVANEGITVLDDKLLVANTYKELQEQVKNYRRTGVLPAATISLASTYNWDPFEVFNRQIGVFNKYQQGDKLDAIEVFHQSQQEVTNTLRNAVKFVMRGQGNQTMVNRLTNDRWPVRSALAQVVPAKGGLQGLTPQDYRDLAYVVSAEAARGTSDIYAVAASVLNRVADPRFPNTVREVMMQDKQYEAVTKGMAYDDPELEAELSSENGQRMIAGMLRRLQGRTDFKGVTQRHNMGPGDVLVDSAGNFFHYSGQTLGSGPWTGEKPTHYMKFISQE
jgi:hypothetical protein